MQMQAAVLVMALDLLMGKEMGGSHQPVE